MAHNLINDIYKNIIKINDYDKKQKKQGPLFYVAHACAVREVIGGLDNNGGER